MKLVAQTFLTFLSAVSPAFLPADAILTFAGWKTCETAGKNACATSVGRGPKIGRNFLSLTVLN